MIKSFCCKESERLFSDRFVGRFRSIERVARRKLTMLHAADRPNDLRVPPGNHLEALKGTCKGQHNIRINDQWRICFAWSDLGVFDVEITDYHR